MTFRADRYPPNWPAIRAQVLERAGNACERCKAPNGRLIQRRDGTYLTGGEGCSASCCEVRDDETGAVLGHADAMDYGGRPVVVVLTVAHLDHVESNCAMENMAAMCQRCHLNHDRPDNARRTRESKFAKRAVGTLPGLDLGGRKP